MKPLHLIIAALLACPLPALALGIDGSIGNSAHRTAADDSSDDEDYSPMLASALNDPYVNAVDLGLVPPGSHWMPASFRQDQE